MLPVYSLNGKMNKPRIISQKKKKKKFIVHAEATFEYILLCFFSINAWKEYKAFI